MPKEICPDGRSEHKVRQVSKLSEAFVYAGDRTGELVAIDFTAVPFDVARIFVVQVHEAGVERGRHAHRQCTQLLVPISGSIKVESTDGRDTRIDTISAEEREALLIPPMIWASQTYLQRWSKLLVLCDQPYNEEEYLRNYVEFEELVFE